MSGNMPRLTKKYPILGAVTECDFRGKIKAHKHWCKLHYALLWIFSRKTRLVTVPPRDSRVLDFPEDSRITYPG